MPRSSPAGARATEVIDGRGRVVVPGLVDAHCHPLWGARAVRDADLTGGVRPRRRARPPRRRRGRAPAAGVARRTRPAARVVRARPPTGAVLDAAVGGRPAFVSFADGHGALANPAALERARRRRPAHVRRCVRDRLRPRRRPRPGSCASRARWRPFGRTSRRSAAARRRALYRAQLERMAAHRPRGRARHGRHPRRPGRPGRARGRRRSAGAPDHPHLAAARHGRRPDRRRDRPGRPVGPALALRRGQVLPRRGRRPGHGVARGAGPSAAARPRRTGPTPARYAEVVGALRGRRSRLAPPTRSAIGPSASRSTPTRPRPRAIRGARPAGSNTSSCAIRAISAGLPPRA